MVVAIPQLTKANRLLLVLVVISEQVQTKPQQATDTALVLAVVAGMVVEVAKNQTPLTAMCITLAVAQDGSIPLVVLAIGQAAILALSLTVALPTQAHPHSHLQVEEPGLVIQVMDTQK